ATIRASSTSPDGSSGSRRCPKCQPRRTASSSPGRLSPSESIRWPAARLFQRGIRHRCSSERGHWRRGDLVVTTARVRPGAGTVLGTFFYMWLLVGLVLGTAVLVGPVRLITEGMGQAGWEQSSQEHVLIFVSRLYLAFSSCVMRWIVCV